MADWPQSLEGQRVVISTVSAENSIGGLIIGSGVAVASSTWPASNRALYVPFLIGSPITVLKMFSYNGTVASGNIDVGIYDSQGDRLISSGSTAQAGTSTLQAFDITDTLLLPGTYYFGAAMDNTTGTVFRANIGVVASGSCGTLQQATAFPLPDPWTAVANASTFIPVIGLTARTVI